ncbi:MAG: PEP-CTERM sorting domain-containing protein [Bryobacteraceae bacterium]
MWSDNGQAFPNNGPATQLAASTTTVLDTSLSITPTSFTFQFSNYPLAANTHYWIMASSPGGNSEAEWWSTFNVSGTDVTTEFADFEGEIFQNVPPADPGDAEAYLMQVNALATSTPAPPPATPAPSSVMLVIIGLCCAGLYFKRRRLSQPS